MTRAVVYADKAFRRMWADGTSIAVMARHYGTNEAVIRDCARRADLPSRVVASGINAAKVKSLWLAGKRAEEIALACDCKESQVFALARDMGLPSRKAVFRPEEMDAELVSDLWFQPIDTDALVAGLGISRAVLARVREHFELPRRNGFTAMTAGDDMREVWRLQRQVARIEACDAPAVAAASDVATPVAGAPFWTPARDAAVRETGGRYAAIAEAAAELGKPIAAVQARWHVLAVSA